MLMYVCFRLAVLLARWLPERAARAFVCWVGRLIYRLSSTAEVSRDNARHVLGADADPAQVSSLARAMFENRALGYYDLVRLPSVPRDEFAQRVTPVGFEHLDRLVEEKQGAVVLTGHLGPLEYMLQAVSIFGFPLITISEHLEPERLDRYVRSLRSSHGLDMMSTKGPLLDVFRRLKRGGFLASAIDRDSTDTGLIVDFMGAPAWMPDGYARVAVQANVPLIFGYCRKTEKGALVQVYPPIYPDRSLGKEKAALDLIQQVLRLFEQTIRAYPKEWYLSSPVWKLAQERLEKETA